MLLDDRERSALRHVSAAPSDRRIFYNHFLYLTVKHGGGG